jgi:hypothetical protein
MFKETLPFYELLRASNLLSTELRNLAKERWIRVKIKQALRERDHGNRKKGEGHLEEARNEFAGLPYSKFDEIPENLPDTLPPVDPTHDEMTSEADVPESLPAEETTVIDSEASNKENYKLASQISDFKLSINPAGTRINIEHAETLEQLAIRLEDSSLKIDGDALEAESDGRYLIDSWGLTVDLSRVGEGEVTLVLKNGMKTSLPVAPFVKAKTGRLKSKSSKK